MATYTATKVSSGTVREGPGTAGTRVIAKRYPVEEGLEAGVTKQTPPPYLEEKGF